MIGFYRITRNETRNERDKTRIEEVSTKETQVNFGKWFRRLVIIIGCASMNICKKVRLLLLKSINFY